MIEGSGFGFGGGPVVVGSVFAGGGRERLGSFCNLDARGERRGVLHESGGQRSGEGGLCLQSFELAEGALEAALDAGLVAGQAVEPHG